MARTRWAKPGRFCAGGHSIEDNEPKYGLAVFGTARPDRIVRNSGARPGDALFCTKALGTGIANAAFRAGLRDDAGMRPRHRLHDGAQPAPVPRPMLAAGAHAATDVTGFGLVGTLARDASRRRGVAAVLDWDALPLFDGVLDLSRDFCRPGKTFGLIEWAGAFTSLAGLDDARARRAHGRALRSADLGRPACGRALRRGRGRSRRRSARRPDAIPRSSDA